VKTTLLALAGLAGALLIAGCGPDKIEPAVKIEEHRMVIIPFKDRLQHHFESDRGTKLAQAVTERLEEKRKELGKDDCIEVVAFEDLVAAVQKRHDDPKDLKHEDLARSVKADLFLDGDITVFQPQIPGNVGFLQGRATVSLRLAAATRPDKALLKRTVSVLFPPDDKTSTGVANAGVTEEDIETGLMALLVNKISELFYAHDPEPGPR
jgi:hypothetical protein